MPRRNRNTQRKSRTPLPPIHTARRKTSTDPDFLARELVRRGLASPAVLGPSRYPLDLDKETR